MNAGVLSLLFAVTVCALGAKVPYATPGFPEDVRKDTAKPEDRIINGNVASKGQFPWQAIVYFYLTDGRHICGGSLISSRYVLTAAHCARNALRFVVSLGSITTATEEQGRVTVYTNKSIVHENYNTANLNNDIALIDLGVDIGSNDHIKPIRLPSKGDVVGVNRQLEVSGWGIVSDSGTVASRNLNYVQLHSISNSACARLYGSSVIVSSTLCALGETIESTCSGDSGGGLIKRENGEATHVGVVSFVNDAGCSLGAPSGYVRTESYLDWISSHTGIPV